MQPNMYQDRIRGKGLLVLWLTCFAALPGCPPPLDSGPNSPTTCFGCHDGRTAANVSLFPFSAHSALTCRDCHGDATQHVKSGGVAALVYNPANAPFPDTYAQCADCHAPIVAEFLTSAHALSESVSCHDCHNIHTIGGMAKPLENNAVCTQCHASLQFPTVASIEAHTRHPVNPVSTGASRCTACHMTPLDRFAQTEAHDHSLNPSPPAVSADAAAMGVTPVPINSCAGIMGCHDGSVATAPVFDVDNQAQMEFLQSLYEVWFPDAP